MAASVVYSAIFGSVLASLPAISTSLVVFDTKVIEPTMLAKHFAQQMNPDGSFVLFSGVNAFKVNIGCLGVAGAVPFAMTNSFLTGVTLKIDGGEPLT